MSAPQLSISESDLSHAFATYQYHPTLWGDHFPSNVSDSNNVDFSSQEQFDGLKEEIRSILMNDSSENICLIDAIQHLAVDYHFKDEIEIALKKLRHNFNSDEDDLNNIALRFRLLRQHGFHVSYDVFEKFKDSKGNFKESLINDVEGMLSLYEAAHLGIRGENILDEAITFTTSGLQSILSTDHTVKPYLIEQIKHALNRPIRKCLQKLEARHYIDVYSHQESHNATILKFAKLDFNILQRQYRKELVEITRWWKILDVATRFPFARDRIVECYFWTVGVYFEPQYSLARMILTKVVAIISLLDDTYDNYASYEQLVLLTKAIQRWDIREMDTLPNYMKKIYATLIDTYNEFEDELAKEGRSYCVNYAKDEMKKVIEAFLIEAKWRNESYVATVEEYMKVSLVSCGYIMLEAVSFLGMRNIATKEVFEWVSANPKIVNASSIVNRLMDDIVSPKYEKKRKHVATGVECYVNQYGVSEEDVVQLFRKEITNAWKDINEEFLHKNPVPKEILERVLNFARVIDVIYKGDDGYTNSYMLKHLVSSLLIDPILDP